MTRSHFIKGCLTGVCFCGAGAGAALADNADELSRKYDAARRRFALLIGVLKETVDTDTRQKILQSLGRECARQYHGLIDKYKGNIRGFLAEGQKQWIEKAEYDEKAGTIRIVDKPRGCSCPLVREGWTPPEFCECTLGWQQEAYSAILGRPVAAEVEESILRGGSRCVFRIRVL